MLEIKNLSITLETTIVDDVSFSLNPGEVMALIGESGSGKTMTARSLLRLLPAAAKYSTKTQILLHGSNLLDLSEQQMRAIRGREICMIFQDPMTCLNPVLTVGEQIAESVRLQQKLYSRQNYIECLRLLDAVKIANPMQTYKSYPHELSGGMKQRIMIAMALAGKPSLLIADEPTTALDVTTQAQILKLIKDLQQQRMLSVLFITHDLAVAAQVADQVSVMRSGKIVEHNSCVDFFKAPQNEYSQRLLNSSPKISISTKQKNIHHVSPILSINNLSVYFSVKHGLFRRTVSQVKAVDDVSLELFAGETLALVGESGCGKTTLGKTLVQLIKPTSGKIDVHDTNLDHAAIQIVFQDPYSALNPKLTVMQALGEILGRQRLDKVDLLLQKVGLPREYKWRYPHQLSGGERQRVCIARALSVQPKIIIFDEPTSSLDVSIQSQVLSLIKELQKQEQLSYLFISHDLAVVSNLADRIAVMYKGKIVEIGATAEVLSNPQHEYTKKLLAAVPSLAKY